MEDTTTVISDLYNWAVPYIGDIGWEGVLAFLFGAIPFFLYTLWTKWKHRRALARGQHSEEVVVNFINVDYDGAGGWFLKPRVAISARPVSWMFPNPAMVEQIVAATKRCDETAQGSFVQLKDPHLHRMLMKQARGIVSGVNPAGQAARSGGVPCFNRIYYVYVTFSVDGDEQRRIRIDAVHEKDLRVFMQHDLEGKIKTRPDEGKHEDHIAILQIVARAVDTPDQDDTCVRTSIPFVKAGEDQE